MRSLYARCETSYSDAILYCYSNLHDKVFSIKESTVMVDGIGGTTWEGALILYECLAAVIDGHTGTGNVSQQLRLLELGAGTGICGLMCASHDNVSSLVLTDRTVDLCEGNLQIALVDEGTTAAVAGTNISVHEIDWDDEPESAAVNTVIQQCRSADGEVSHFDIIFGAEITCLVKQQSKLINTMHQLVQTSDTSRIFFTFDDLPPPFSQTNYESKFNKEIYEEYGYKSVVVCSGCCRWTVNDTSKCGGDLCSDSTCIKCLDICGKVIDAVKAGDRQVDGDKSEAYEKVSYGSCGLVYHVDNLLATPLVLSSAVHVHPLPVLSETDPDAGASFETKKRLLMRALLQIGASDGAEGQCAAVDARMATLAADQVDCTMFHHVVMYYRE